ncbi:MAG: SO_0444 family Cu/Zn efflux transporter [bacterium]|nr:SO_0444 family Cu/Zn efflux transporter [bacterium]
MFEQFIEIMRLFWETIGEMAPFLLFGFLAAGVLSVVVSSDWIERHLGSGKISPVIKASAFGVPLPLCSCSVIPVATSLRRHGASKGATTAFLISTPQTGVDSIFATFSLLGWVFAIFRPVAALISGIVGGSIVAMGGNSDKPSEPEQSKCCSACCSAKGKGKIVTALQYGLLTLPKDIGKALLIGLLVGAIITVYIGENNYFSETVPPGILQIFLLMLVGIPLYICATASIPIAASLILAGVSPGAAFAMLMTGPATNAATVITIWKVLGPRTCLIYLGTMMVSAIVGGILLDQLISIEQIQTSMHHDWLPPWLRHAAGVILIALLTIGTLKRPDRKAD